MAGERLTPWERAKADSQTFSGPLPKVLSAAAGAVIAVVLQAVLGWPEGRVTPYAITLGSAMLVLLLFWMGERVLNWWRAPVALLTDDVAVLAGRIRELDDYMRSSASPAEEKDRLVRIALQAVLTELDDMHRIVSGAVSVGQFWYGGYLPDRAWTHDWMTLGGQSGFGPLMDACRSVYSQARSVGGKADVRVKAGNKHLNAADTAQLEMLLKSIATADQLLRGGLDSLERP